MKKIIYIVLVLVLFGALGFYFLSQREVDSDVLDNGENDVDLVERQPLSELSSEDFVWSEFLPKEVPEYMHGEISEFSIPEEEMALFEEEIEIIIEETNLEELEEYIENLETEGWMRTFSTREGEYPYSVQLSYEDLSIGVNIDEEGLLTFNFVVLE